MEDSPSVGNDLEMYPNEKNEGAKVVSVDKSSKLSLCDDGEDHKNANEKIIIWLQMKKE